MIAAAERDAIPTTAREAHTILLVDDDPNVLASCCSLLSHLGYHTETARDGVEAIHKLELGPDLVVVDADMPHMDGFQVVAKIRRRADPTELPIIMVTGHATGQYREHAFEVGVNDFLGKPFDLVELKLRAASLIGLKTASDQLRQHEQRLAKIVEARTAALRTSLDRAVEAERRLFVAHTDTIGRLVSATASRDRDTGAHALRIGRYASIVARSLGMPPRRVDLIGHAAPLHDLGKLGVPDAVLRKSGPLDEEEWRLMRRHPEIGFRILQDSPSDLMRLGGVIALSHHERWDGDGYPGGLRGAQIPVEGRICAVVDVFDALTADRPYRPAMSVSEAVGVVRAGAGSHFDPMIVEAFDEALDSVTAVHADKDVGEVSEP